MSSNEVLVREFRSLATRESGAAAREFVLERLKESAFVVLDFTGAHPSPSFADEFVGRLAEVLGAIRFNASIRVRGANRETRPLLQQVISRRLGRFGSPPKGPATSQFVVGYSS